jgi:hypothetical protein
MGFQEFLARVFLARLRAIQQLYLVEGLRWAGVQEEGLIVTIRREGQSDLPLFNSIGQLHWQNLC